MTKISKKKRKLNSDVGEGGYYQNRVVRAKAIQQNVFVFASNFTAYSVIHMNGSQHLMFRAYFTLCISRIFESTLNGR